MTASGSFQDLELLRRRAATLKAEADALQRTYDRTTWIRFVLVFFPIPFVVLLLRLEIDAWVYYLAGASIIVSAAVLYTIDGAASDKVDAATRAAEKAQRAYEEATRKPLASDVGWPGSKMPP